jgi:polar amino acid transport system substrate-binding protein
MKKARVFVVLVLMLGFLAACTTGGQVYSSSSTAPVLARIEKRGELVVGTAASMPPLNMTTKDGRIIGLDIDLANYLADSADVKLRIEKMLFKDLLPALEAGKVDMVISGMTITAERNARVAFVGPYYISGKGVLTSVATLSSITSPDDLDKKEFKLTALAGSTSERFVKIQMPEATYMPAADYDAGVQMVIDGTVDAMIADHPICIISVARYPQHDLFTIVSPFTYEPLGIALPAGDPLFVNLVDNLLNSVEGSGALDRARRYWFGQGEWFDQLP